MKLVGHKLKTDKVLFYIMDSKLMELAITVVKTDSISRFKNELDKFMNNWSINTVTGTGGNVPNIPNTHIIDSRTV